MKKCDSNRKLWELKMLIKNDWIKKATFTFELTKFNNIIIIEISEKQTLLKNNFFSSTRQTNFDDIERFNYSFFKKFFIIIEKEIRIAINTNHLNKIVEDDELTFRVLQITLNHIKIWLQIIYNAYIDLRYCFKHFRHSKTMILRKFDKNDYIQFKTYRSIVLLNALEKRLEKIIITRLNYLIEKY